MTDSNKSISPLRQQHISLGQLKVTSAIERCRSAALGGHVLRCEGCPLCQDSCRLKFPEFC